jgi:biopolymer transport protein ExbD
MKKTITLLGLLACLSVTVWTGIRVHWKRQQHEAIVVRIASNGGWFLENERVDRDGLSAVLKQDATKQRKVSICAEKNAPFESIVAVMDVCRAVRGSGMQVARETNN